MFDFPLDDSEKKILDEARDFFKWVPLEIVLDYE